MSLKILRNSIGYFAIAKFRNKRYTLLVRREYDIEPITVNRITINKVVIDSHYEEKHSADINDVLIIELVKQLNGRIEAPEVVDEEFSYFVTLLSRSAKQYRLIWLLEENEIYVGVINAYRDDRKE